MKNLHEVSQEDILCFGRGSGSATERLERWLAFFGALVVLGLLLAIVWRTVMILAPDGATRAGNSTGADFVRNPEIAEHPGGWYE